MIRAAAVDLSLRPPVGNFGVLDFRAAKELVEVGYRYTVEQLQGANLADLCGDGPTD